MLVQYTVTDGGGRSATGILSLVVSPLPTVLGPVALPDVGTVTQNAAATDFAVLANDLDPTNTGLSLTAASIISSLPTATHTVSLAGNQLRIAPASGFAGTVLVQYTVTDGGGRSAIGILSLVVSPLPTVLGPVALPDAGTVTQNAAATNFAVLANDLDPTSAGLSLTAASVSSSLPSATHTVSLAGNQLRFTPASGFAGTVLVQYTVTDGGGRSATGILSLVVSPLPTVLGPVALPDVGTVTQNAAATDFAVLANDLDPASAGLSLTVASISGSLPIATHTVSLAGNQLRFTPASGFAGTVLVQYTVTDGNARTAAGLLSLVVSPLAPLAGPVALPDVAVLAQNSAATLINVRANDVDPAAAGLTVTAASVQSSLPSASHTVAVNSNQVQFTPAASFAGIVTLAYTVRDGNNATSNGLVAITVTPSSPVALPAAIGDVGALVVTLLAGSTGNYSVLANDIDPSAGGLTLQTVSFVNPLLVTPGSLLSIVGSQVRLTVPLLGVITGVLPIQYTATDSLGRTITGLLSVTLSI